MSGLDWARAIPVLRATAIAGLAIGTLLLPGKAGADPSQLTDGQPLGLFGESSVGHAGPDSATGAMQTSYAFKLPRARGRVPPVSEELSGLLIPRWGERT